MDAKTIKVDSEEFNAVLITVARAAVMLGCVKDNEPAGIDQAPMLQLAAEGMAGRVQQLLLHPHAEDGDQFRYRYGMAVCRGADCLPLRWGETAR